MDTKELQQLISERDSIVNNPKDCIDAKLADVNYRLERREFSKTTPSKEGNTTVFQVLMNLKNTLENRPQDYLNSIIAEHNLNIQEAERSINGN